MLKPVFATEITEDTELEGLQHRIYVFTFEPGLGAMVIANCGVAFGQGARVALSGTRL